VTEASEQQLASVSIEGRLPAALEEAVKTKLELAHSENVIGRLRR
jgi:hypothetical protein